MSNATIVFDVDTQWDLVMPEGAWPVPGAAACIPSFERICRYAAMYNLRVLASTRRLAEGDPSFQSAGGECPPHCISGAPGARKIPATRPRQAVTVENRAYGPGELESLVGSAREVIIETSGPDPFGNPNLAGLLKGVSGAFVFGVAGEDSVGAVVRALLGRGIKVEIVENAVAVRSGDPEARERWLEELSALGARRVRDLDIMTRYTTSRHR